MNGDQANRRMLRGAMILSYFKASLIDVANGICRQAVDRDVRYSEALKALENVLPPNRHSAVHDAIEDMYLPSFSKDLSYARREKEELRQIARFLIIENFEDFLMACLRHDFPDLFENTLRLLMKVPALKATEFTRPERFCAEANPLAYLWAVVIAYKKGTPVEDSLGYKEIAGTLPRNAAHVHRARKFIRTLSESVKCDGPMKQVEQLVVLEASRATDAALHPITVTLDDETWQKLGLVVERHGGGKTTEAVAESLLRVIINRMLAKNKPT